MTHLRQLMIEELQRRNFAETTIRSYVHGVEHFSRYFHRSPDQLGPEHIRKYQAMLLSKLKFSPNTVIQRLGALRFFYHVIGIDAHNEAGGNAAFRARQHALVHGPEARSQCNLTQD